MNTRKAIRQSWRDSYSGDPWGRVMAWKYAVADAMVFKFGMRVPGFRPSPLGPERNEIYALVNRQLTRRTIIRLWKILDRLESIHRAAGRDY